MNSSDSNYDAVIRALGSLPTDVQEDVAEQIILFEQNEFAAFTGGREAMFRDILNKDRVYAIHDDDLEILGQCAAVAAAIYVGLPNPVTLIGGLVLCLYKFRKKRIELTAYEALVLDHIRKCGTEGTRLDKLIANFSANEYPSLNVNEVLHNLSNARRKDGTKAPLIEDQDDRLIALDV